MSKYVVVCRTVGGFDYHHALPRIADWYTLHISRGPWLQILDTTAHNTWAKVIIESVNGQPVPAAASFALPPRHEFFHLLGNAPTFKVREDVTIDDFSFLYI